MDWLSLFLLALLIATTYFLTIQGLISAVIMCVLCLVSAALAFAVYEWVAMEFLFGTLGDTALPAALIGTYALPLIVFRLLLDAYVTRASLLPVLVDRVCGGVAGFVAAYLSTGVLAVAIQMVPFGGSFLGHAGLDPASKKETSLWLGPDRFAVTYASMMSQGLFSGGRRWRELHPDLVSEIIAVQSAPAEVRHVVPDGSVSLVRVETRESIFDKKPGSGRGDQRVEPEYTRIDTVGGKSRFTLRLALKPEAADEDETHRFSRRQLRLVGQDRPNGPVVNHYPIAISDNDRPQMACRIEDGKLYMPGSGNEVDFVFEVPEGFVPHFAEYKSQARVDLLGKKAAPADVAAVAPPPASPSPSPPSPASGGADRVSGVRGRAATSSFSHQLPMPMTKFESAELEQTAGALANGHVYGNAGEQGGDGSNKLTTFAVPAGKRMFQLDVQQLRAGSTLGQALNFAVTSLKDYQLNDEAGNRYPVVGQFAQANVDGVDVVEVQYFPETAEMLNRGGMRPFRRIRKSDLESDQSRLVLLFLVQPGAKLTEFTTGAGRRPTDLRSFNLTAPN